MAVPFVHSNYAQVLHSMIQALLERAVEDIKNSLVATLPTAGFEQVEFNSGWKAIE